MLEGDNKLAGFLHECKKLVTAKASEDHGNLDAGLNALMEAASGGFVQVGRFLIDHQKVKVNATSNTSARDTDITIASAKGHVKFVKLLLENGAKANLKTSVWNSPLWLAAFGSHLEVVERLYKAKADIGSEV